MNRIFLGAGLACMLWACTPNAQESDDRPSVEYDPKVEELLSQMTLKEKIGQMTQITLQTVSDLTYDTISLDTEVLKKHIQEYGVGSFLNCGGQARSRQDWSRIIGEMQQLAMEESRLNIPILYGIDAIHGTNYTVDATLFPQQVGLAATWNPGLVEEAAALAAYETRASSIPWTFSPVLDLGIDPRWPRMWEGFGEDPYLQSQMGVAMTAGFQGEDVSADDRVAACLKHYIGYGTPRSGKDRTPAWIPEIMLRELFIPPFQAAIDAGAKTIMVNSGEVNGEPVHASKFLLSDILRDELGFTGVAVTDWYDIINLVERHHTAATYKEAVRQSIEAGVDMSMVP
ncbi:MAG: glycoside hydrolase family 3 N-terminal domain-containing protein, partial [Bacteroidota bacterium]